MITDGAGVVLSYTVADDAGALLVRSGLVMSSALEDARSRVADEGGTIGEQLVIAGLVGDDALTDFYKTRLLVPQVNPNTLARLPAKVVAVIPSDMAIELRAIPVSLDADNNLTVAMSDPSDRHAVDEIAFFTGAYVVRAVATQMQIAWCLAHYYGHVTALGQRLLQPHGSAQPTRAAQAAVRTSPPRTRGVTGQVQAMRKRALVPVAADAEGAETAEAEAEAKTNGTNGTNGADAAAEGRPRARSISGEIRIPGRRAPSIKPPLPDDSNPVIAVDVEEPSAPVITIEAESEASGRTAAAAASSETAAADSELPTDRQRAIPKRTRPADPDPPELAARAGEIGVRTRETPSVEVEEPRIVIADDLTAPADAQKTQRIERLRSDRVPTSDPGLGDVSGEVAVREHVERNIPPPSITVEISDEPSAPVVIHEQLAERSEPVLLDRRRSGASDAPTSVNVTAAPARPGIDDEEDPVVELAAPKARGRGVPRGDRTTQVGIGVVSAITRPRAMSGDGIAGESIPSEIDDQPTADVDPTKVDTQAAPPGDYTSGSDELAPPPAPFNDEDTSPHVAAPRPSHAVPGPSGQIRLDRVQRAPSHGDDDDDDSPHDHVSQGRPTAVMSSIELDELVPGRQDAPVPAHLQKRAASRSAPRAAAREPRVDEDEVDDGWGPPGTTIPPPLLGAIPGSVEPASGMIPMPNMDSAPLIVAPPAPPERGGYVRAKSSSDANLVRAFEEASARMLELIHALDRTQDRDEVVTVMIAHLAETHQRAGFFAVRGGVLSMFAVTPRPAAMPLATLRLDRPSTLQDVVDTRLPYRGPMHDDASRTFLMTVLGACPPEILLVPVTVRERVVGVLFGDHRVRHTFDDQLALAARAAGNALERILKARRG